MTTSNYSADIKVEAGFGSGFGTPLATITWTDISPWVEFSAGISRDFGRADERSTADANRVSFTLDNRDGRFTPGRAGSPYFPNVVLGTPIRVTVQRAGGAGFVTRFVGYVNRWSSGWPGATDNWSTAVVSAMSRLTRLGRAPVMPSRPAARLLARPSLRYLWPCDDAAGTQLTALRGDDAMAPLAGSGNLVFGVDGPGIGAPTAAQFTATADRTHFSTPTTTLATATDLTALAFIKAPPTFDPDDSFAFSLFSGSGLAAVWLSPPGTASTKLYSHTGTTFSLNPVQWADDRWHLLALRWTGPSVDFSIDGAVQATRTSAVQAVGPFRVGIDLYDTDGGAPSVISVSTVAVLDEALTDADLRDLTAAIVDSDVWTADRFRFIAETVLGISSAELVLPASVPAPVLMRDLETYGKNPVDALRDVETAEDGVLHDAADGTLVLAPRGARYGIDPALVLDAGIGDVQADFTPQLDDSALANDVVITGVNGTGRARDQASVDAYGSLGGTIDTLVTRPEDPQDRATWIVATRGTPQLRAPTLSISLYELTGSQQDAALALTIGSMVETINLPDQADASTKRWFVEGISDQMSLESWQMTLNVSPVGLEDNVLVFDDPVRGVWDSGVVLGY